VLNIYKHWPPSGGPQNCVLSEYKLERQLNVAVLLDVVDVREESASRGLNRNCRIVCDVVRTAGYEQIRMIEEVEELGPELQPLALSDRNVASKGKPAPRIRN
jgi:hypothetical protein